MKQVTIEFLAWDSNFLGFPVGRVAASGLAAASLEALINQSRSEGMRLLYLVLSPTDAETAGAVRKAGAWLADQKVTFTRQADACAATVPGPAAGRVVQVSSFTRQLEQLAWQSGVYSRFRRDEKFAPQVFSRLYSHWLRASLRGELAQAVFAYLSPAGKEAGLLTLEKHDGSARVGLLAVDSGARRQGVGQELVAAACQEAQRWGSTELQVITQRDNEAACRFYTRCGFQLAREEHIYHLWL